MAQLPKTRDNRNGALRLLPLQVQPAPLRGEAAGR